MDCTGSWSMGFSRQESWSGLPFPSPGDLPEPGIEPGSLALGGGFVTTEPLGKPSVILNYGDFAHIYLDARYYQTKGW